MNKVVFLHPDLGIGGAERLIVDMALALQSCGHEVTIYTSHHDPSHCFTETKDGTLKVISKFDWLPRHILGKCFALCAVLRMMFLALYVCLSLTADVFIVDQVSACIPILKWLSSSKVLFYCHFPDMLLTQRVTMLKRLYRKPLDWLEGWSTSIADKIFVNSRFTEGIVKLTFPQISDCDILYPSLNFDKFENTNNPVCDIIPESASTVFLSMNRYERKKEISLALQAFASLQRSLSVTQYTQCHLIIAGGYDERVTENVEYHLELAELADKLKIADSVTFLCSVDDDTKLYLLRNSTALIYTPSNEHFGIVPIEAMYCATPVIAVNTGGPLETVKQGETGFLCNPLPGDFGRAMGRFVEEPGLSAEMGLQGVAHVKKRFSFTAFTDTIDEAVRELSGEI